jgi:hypothetical protein
VAAQVAALVVCHGSCLQEEMHKHAVQLRLSSRAAAAAVARLYVLRADTTRYESLHAQNPLMLVMIYLKQFTLAGSSIQGVSMRVTAALVCMLLQDRFAENKDALQDILNEIVTLKELQ